MDKQPIPYNPALLRWARLEAGLSLDEAAERAGISAPRKRKDEKEQQTPADRLKAWENGALSPTLPQLEDLAAAYRRPLTTFFLLSPPAKQTNLADFRTIGSKSRQRDTPEFAAFKRRLEARHAELKEIMQLEGKEPIRFIGSACDTRDAKIVVKAMRKTLNFSFSDQQTLPSSEELLRVLRARIQFVGIFVLIEGDLGSHHTKISTEEFRGIAFADKLAPLIVINSNDTNAAKLFTLLHELAHLWIGESGISNLNAFSHGLPSQPNREKQCNAIAAEFLVPENELKNSLDETKYSTAEEAIDDLSKLFKVSKEVVARRMLDFDYISSDTYSGLIRAYHEIWKKYRERMRDSGSGPSRNKLDYYRLGEHMLNTVTGAAADGRITYQEAARILRIPVSRFDKVLYAHN